PAARAVLSVRDGLGVPAGRGGGRGRNRGGPRVGSPARAQEGPRASRVGRRQPGRRWRSRVSGGTVRSLRSAGRPVRARFAGGRARVSRGCGRSEQLLGGGDRDGRRPGCGTGGRGATVVSGAARGVDACAHESALASGGRTIAVLGSGIDVAYPRTNRSLIEAIAGTGSVVSEYPPGTPAEPFRFPARNRIVAALSSAVVIVE